MSFTETGGKIFLVDTLEYAGKLWLVIDWDTVESPEGQLLEPRKLVGLHTLKHQKMPENSKFPFQYMLNYAIPKSVFSGHVPHESEDVFEVIDNPGLQFRVAH